MGPETTRLDWVRAKSLTKDKNEKLLLGLKIARYDYVTAKRHHNESGVKKAKKQISDLNRRLNNKKLDDEIRAIETLHKNERKQIEYDKKLGYTFGIEKRNGKEYLYKQKKTGGQKEHEYIAKNWQDLDQKQNLQAQEQVWQDRWALKDLAPSERETFDLIQNETPNSERYDNYKKFLRTLPKKELEDVALEKSIFEDYEYQKQIDGFPKSDPQSKARGDILPPDPILEKASKQLGMKTYQIKSHEVIKIKPLSIQQIKNILRATRKALIRRGNIDKKIESMALMISEGNTDPGYIENFVAYVIKDSGVLHGKRIGGRKIGPIKIIEDYVNGLILRNRKHMYAVLEPIEVRVFAENIVKEFKKMGGYYWN